MSLTTTDNMNLRHIASLFKCMFCMMKKVQNNTKICMKLDCIQWLYGKNIQLCLCHHCFNPHFKLRHESFAASPGFGHT